MTPNQVDRALANFRERTGVKAKRIHLSKSQIHGYLVSVNQTGNSIPDDGVMGTINGVELVVSNVPGPHISG